MFPPFLHFGHGDDVHIGEVLVFAAHRPDKIVMRCSDAEMHLPRRRNDRLLIAEDHVAAFLRLADDFDIKRILRHTVIHEALHAALVRMRRDGVPYIARLNRIDAHLELVALHGAALVNVLLHNARARRRLIAAGVELGFLRRNMNRGMLFKGKKARHIELCRPFRVFAGKDHILCAAADVRAVLEVHIHDLAIGDDLSFSTNVDDAHFACLKEVLLPDLILRLQTDLVADRHDTAENKAFVKAVRQHSLVGSEHRLNQDPVADLLRCQGFQLKRGNAVLDLHGFVLLLLFIFPSSFRN